MKNAEYSVRLENAELHLLIGGLNTADYEETTHATHTHTLSELFVCGRGRIVIRTQTGHLTLHSGDAAIVPPGVFHALHRTDSGTLGCAFRFHCLRLNDGDDFYSCLLPFLGGEEILVYRGRPQLWRIGEKILENAGHGPRFLPALLLAELLMGAAATPGTDKRPAPADIGMKRSDLQTVVDLDDLLGECYSMNVGAAEMAERLNVSNRHLYRLVRKVYGKTPHELITDKRIRAAELLLDTTDLTVAQVAAEVGFGSSAGLYREFSRRHGVTPTEYRRRQGNNERL